MLHSLYSVDIKDYSYSVHYIADTKAGNVDEKFFLVEPSETCCHCILGSMFFLPYDARGRDFCRVYTSTAVPVSQGEGCSSDS
jgi:hypothetical protein